MKKNNRGFTLIELMLVVIIIGVLGAVVIPRFVGRAKEAKIAAAKAAVNNNLAVALDLYEMDNGFYPGTDQGIEALKTKPSSSPAPQNWRGPYIKKKTIDPWGNLYIYVSPGIHNDDYDLYSYGPDGADGGGDDVTNWEE
ncbi:MAG: type II secretion system major pseudopilin GspG [Candidatus Omnitrophota bacterium]